MLLYADYFTQEESEFFSGFHRSESRQGGARRSLHLPGLDNHVHIISILSPKPTTHNNDNNNEKRQTNDLANKV